jgi:hypothetical protein
VPPTSDIIIRAQQSARDTCRKKYGFVCDPDLPKHTNLFHTLQAYLHDHISIDSAPQNRKVHNLCRDPTLVPPDVLHALGLGLGYCLSLKRKDENPIDFERFRKAIRTHYTFRNQPPRKLQFPKLYVKRGDDWDPDLAPRNVEKAMDEFERQTTTAFRASRNNEHTYNLPAETIQKLRDLKKAQQFRVTATDKNLGPAIMEMDVYIRQALVHLEDRQQYREINQETATELDEANYRRILRSTVDNSDLDAESRIFFTKKLCGLRNKDGIVQRPDHLQLPYFYALPKVHKTPWKTRPVVSGVSTVFEPLRQWIDTQLKRVIHLCPSYLKDGWQLVHALRDIQDLPPDAVCYTADAVSMYSNINTDHGIETIAKWLQLHRAELPFDFPTALVLDGLDTVMRHNVFAFGARRFLQLDGTAMGTSCACNYATIYYSYHEETKLLANPTYLLLFYRRFIDDAFVIQRASPNGYADFVHGMNDFGRPGARLEWEATPPGREVDFLDLHIRLDPAGTVSTTSFQKPMNLYLYRPPSSAQPSSILYGLIYGTLHRYYWHNTERSMFEQFAWKFFGRLQQRGHAVNKLATLFLRAARQVDVSSIPLPKPANDLLGGPDGVCFLHL